MNETRPTLILLVPEHHDLDPAGIDDLWQHIKDTYGAELSLVRCPRRRDNVVPLYAGPWRWDGPVPLHDDLWWRIQRTTFTLDWMHGVL